MAEIIRLTCPTCGGKLEVTEDIERFACSYCGNEHVVIRRGGVVSLKPVVEQLEQVKVGTDRTASELALVRLEKEITQLAGQLNALQSSEGQWALFFVLCLVAGAILLPRGTFEVFRWILIVLGIIFLAVWRSGENKRSAKRREIETLLEAKRQEYVRHQEIVEKT